jgi:hypothetical protein
MVRERYRSKKQSLRDNVAEHLGRIDKLLWDRENSNQVLERKIRDFIEDVKIYA